MPLRKRPVHFLRGFLRLLWDTSGAFGVRLMCKKREEHISPGFFVQMAAGLTVGLLHVLFVILCIGPCIQAMKKEHEEETAIALQALLSSLIHAKPSNLHMLSLGYAVWRWLHQRLTFYGLSGFLGLPQQDLSPRK